MYSRSTGEMRASCSASATVALSESSSISFVEAAPRFFIDPDRDADTDIFTRAARGEGVGREAQVTVVFAVDAYAGVVSFDVTQQLFTNRARFFFSEQHLGF